MIAGFFLPAPVSEAQIPERTLGGFVYPLGTEARFQPMCSGRWLARDSDSDGCRYIENLYHTGLDLPARVGDLVYPIADGEVVSVSTTGWDPGNMGVLIRHKRQNGEPFLALYGHIITPVGVGFQVVAGVPFAHVGSVAGTDHLHFGIVSGETIPTTVYYGENNPNNRGWGRMGNNNWFDTNGLVDPTGWFNNERSFFDKDARARQDMRDRALRDPRFLRVVAPPWGQNTFTIITGWDPTWEMREMKFDFAVPSSQISVSIFQITSIFNSMSRYTTYFDPQTEEWAGWQAAQ